MNREALSMAAHLTEAVARNEVNAQYHWANLIMLDALARGARGPEPQQTDARRYMNNQPGELYGLGPMEIYRKGGAATDQVLSAYVDATMTYLDNSLRDKAAAIEPDPMHEQNIAMADGTTAWAEKMALRIDAEDAIEEAKR